MGLSDQGSATCRPYVACDMILEVTNARRTKFFDIEGRI
jgi:hypothetical protein